MAVIAADIVYYWAVNRPDDDVSLVGGAIDTAARPLDAQNPANTDIEALSDGADTRTITVKYRDTAGVLQTGTIVLNGATPVALGATVRANGMYEMSIPTDASRTVTVRIVSGGATLHIFNPNETFTAIQFRGSVSSTVVAKKYYEKLFVKNTHATDAFTLVTNDEVADTTGLYAKGVAPSIDDSATAADRLTAPASVTLNSASQDVPADQKLDAGEAIGVWFELSLGIAEAAGQDTFDNETAGT